MAVAVSSPAATPSTSASVTVTSAPATSVPEPNVVVEPIPGPTSAREERNDVPPPAPPMRPIITHTSPEGCETQQEPAGLSPVTEEPSSGCDFVSISLKDF